MNKVRKHLLQPLAVHVNLAKEPQVSNLASLHLNVQALLHGLVPEQILHMLQKALQSEPRIVWFEFMRIQAGEIEDVAHEEVEQGQVLAVLLNDLISEGVAVLHLRLHNLIIDD